ncbi:hypothetical protein Hypma_003360 [Hypsizygus marmoreus]|uniref:Uncharacterized protein n=1 Tax=Hypsizygus marmoreus TaxID=39966 RepID=A0A369JBA5_HYPMA|nr:hypothetical protein Hypma_003360 [Hypsizygus marmoreus]
MGASRTAPKIARDMTSFKIAMDDLVTLVSLSEIKNKAALLALLEGIIAAGLSSSRHLLSYTEDLQASITIILATAEAAYTTIAASPFTQEGLVCRAMHVFGLCNFDAEAGDKAFIHTLQIFELLIHDLTHANSLTAQSLISLENKMTSVKRLVDEETNEVSEEIGVLLGRLWTVLGGNRGYLHHARSRYHALNQTGEQTKAMKKIVLDVQLELAGIQRNCDRLRSYAAAPLLSSSAVPKKGVVLALSEGCRRLRARIEGTRDLDLKK